MPIIWLLRFFANAFTLTPQNGTEALVWLFHQKPESLNPLVKYLSATTGFGSNYVTSKKMDLDEDTAEKFYQKLLKLEKQIRVTMQKTNNQNWKWCSLKHSVPFGDSGVRGFLLSWIMCICGKHWFLMVSSLQNHLCDYVCVCMWEKNIWYFISL